MKFVMHIFSLRTCRTSRLLHGATLVAATAALLAIQGGCAHEISHTESDKPGWFGGSTHKEETTVRNADGTISHEQQQTTVRP